MNTSTYIIIFEFVASSLADLINNAVILRKRFDGITMVTLIQSLLSAVKIFHDMD